MTHHANVHTYFHALLDAAALRDTIRQYYIKLDDDEPLGGLATAKNWILRGPQNDTLGLHEFLGMKISQGAGWWAPHMEYTEASCCNLLAFRVSSSICTHQIKLERH